MMYWDYYFYKYTFDTHTHARTHEISLLSVIVLDYVIIV